jgi:hypothetical protein
LSRFFRWRTTPPFGSLEGQCSCCVLPRATFAGPGERPYNLTGPGFAVRCWPLPHSRAFRALDVRRGLLVLNGPSTLPTTRANVFRRVARRDRLTSPAVRPSPNPRPIKGARRHRSYANAVPYAAWKSHVVFVGGPNRTSVLSGFRRPPSRPVGRHARRTSVSSFGRRLDYARSVRDPAPGGGAKRHGGAGDAQLVEIDVFVRAVGLRDTSGAKDSAGNPHLRVPGQF